MRYSTLMLAAALAASSVLTLGPASARAAAPTEDHWYGWQILVSGAASFGVAALATTTSDSDAEAAFFGVGAAGYLLGGPIVHWAHGHTIRGFESLGLNVGMPLAAGLVMGLIGSAADWDNSAMSGFDAGFVFVGMPLGALAAVLVDGIVLGHEAVPVGSTAGLSLGVGRTSGGLALSLGGRF